MGARGDDLIADLVQALRAEESAREELRSARRRQAAALRELRALGIPSSRVAHRVAAARGLVLAFDERHRLAERLRKRRWRGTRCPDDLVSSHGQSSSAASRLDRALPPIDKESIMPTLVKRTTVTETEEFVEDPESTPEEDESDEEESEEAEEPDEPARSRRRR